MQDQYLTTQIGILSDALKNLQAYSKAASFDLKGKVFNLFIFTKFGDHILYFFFAKKNENFLIFVLCLSF